MSEKMDSAHGPHRGKRLVRLRSVVCLVVFLSLGAGLAFKTGWGTISSMGIDAVAYICPLGALETLLASHTIVPRAFIALIVAAIVIALVGRVFCAWICPIPPLENILGVREKSPETTRSLRASIPAEEAAEADMSAEEAVEAGVPAEEAAIEEPLTGRSTALPPIGGARDGFHFDMRYGVLIGALLSSALFGFPVFCLICPVGLTFATAIAVWQLFAMQTPSWSLLAFPAILAVELIALKGKWCHAFCPLGALMSLLSAKAPLLHPRVDEKACLRSKGGDCRVCVSNCPEKLDPHIGSIPECTKCGACMSTCPAQAISLRLRSSGTRAE